MSEPTTKDELVRVQGNQRIDVGDFQHLTRGALGTIESVVGKLFGPAGVVSGFNATVNPGDGTQVRITKGSGAFIALDRGGSDRPWPAGVDSQSYLMDVGGVPSVDLACSGLGAGQYHVYVLFAWVASRMDTRAFWTAPSGPEYPDNINTRYVPTWSAQIVAHGDPAPTGSVRVASVAWNGSSLIADNVYNAKQSVFEGTAVPGGSDVAVPANGGFAGFDGPLKLPDFDRDEDRGTHELANFAQFANAVLKCIEEVKDGWTGGWWREPAYKQSIRSAAPYTFTIGAYDNDQTSGGNWNADVGGDITDALKAIALIAPTFTPYVTIFLKTGAFQITDDVEFHSGVRILGAGVWATSLQTNGHALIQTTDAGVFQASDIVFSAGTSPNACIQVWADALIERCWHGSSGVNPTFVTQSYGGAGSRGFDFVDIQATGSIDLSVASPIRIRNCDLGDIIVNGYAGAAAPNVQIRNTTIQRGLQVFKVENGIEVEGGRLGAALFSAVKSDIVMRGVLFSGDAIVAGSAVDWRCDVAQASVTGAGKVLLHCCTFVAGDGVGGARVELTSGNATALKAFDVANCAFMPDKAHATWTGDAAVTVSDGPYPWAVARDCRVVDAAAIGFENVNVVGAHVHKLVNEGLATAAFKNCIVRGAVIESALSTTTALADGCPTLERITANVPGVNTTHWQIVPPSSAADFVIKDGDFPQFICDWRTFTGAIFIERCTSSDIMTLLVPTDALFNDCRVQLRDVRADQLSIEASNGATVLGAFIRLERVVAPGVLDLSGFIQTLDVLDCVFEGGLTGALDLGANAKSCEIARSIFWPRGDASGDSATGGLAWPSGSFPLALTSSFLSIHVHHCEIHGLLDDAFTTYGGSVTLVGTGRTIFEHNKLLFGCTADTSVDTLAPILLAGREAICRDNTIIVDNATGNDVAIARLAILRGTSAVAGPVRAKSSIVLAFDDNVVDFCPANTGVHVAKIKNRLLQLELPASSVGQVVLASCDRNKVQMTSVTSCNWAETTVGNGVHVGGGTMHGNVHTDANGAGIGALSNASNVTCGTSTGDLFDVANDIHF